MKKLKSPRETTTVEQNDRALAVIDEIDPLLKHDDARASLRIHGMFKIARAIAAAEAKARKQERKACVALAKSAGELEIAVAIQARGRKRRVANV